MADTYIRYDVHLTDGEVLSVDGPEGSVSVSQDDQALHLTRESKDAYEAWTVASGYVRYLQFTKQPMPEPPPDWRNGERILD